MRRFTASASLLVVCFSASAQDTRLICPERVRLDSATFAQQDLPASAKALVTPAPQLLSGVSVFDGPPEEGAELKPMNAGKNDARSLWQIESPSPQGVWLACNYGSAVARVVMKAEGIPAQCEAQMTRGGSTRVLRATLSCKR